MFADVRTGLSGRESKVRVERGSGSFGQLIVRLGPLRMRWMASFLICMVIAGGGVATQPESARTVAAFEVPLPSEADRNEFLSVLRAAAEVEGMHVDAASKAELEREANVSPNFKMTMKAAVWRGSNDDEGVASAMDLITGAGVWAFMANIHDQQMWLAFVVAVSPCPLQLWPINGASLVAMPSTGHLSSLASQHGTGLHTWPPAQLLAASDHTSSMRDRTLRSIHARVNKFGSPTAGYCYLAAMLPKPPSGLQKPTKPARTPMIRRVPL
jgi:hypothetical protein